MSLTYGLQNGRDLFEKLKRDAALLEKEVSRDHFFHFVITAYHLCEWLEHDSAIHKKVKSDLVNIRKEKSIAVCRDIANASKHYKLNKNYKNLVTDSADSSQGYGMGRYGAGAYGVGEEQIDIVLSDGTKLNALELKNNVIVLWKGFFSKHLL